MRSMKFRRVALLTVIVWASSGASTFAQARRAMTLVDVLNVPRLSDAQLSPDGRQVLYVLSEADWEANRRIRHIWRVNADGSGTTQMTFGTRGESSPRWSPDGQTIAFRARRGDATQIYLLPNAGGESRPLTHHPTSVSSISWSPDGQAIYFLASDDRTAEEKARLQARDDVYRFDEDHRQQHLWRVSVADGTEERITGGDYSVRAYRLSRDGRKVAFHRQPNPGIGFFGRGEVWVMDTDGRNARQLTQNNVFETNAALSPDSSQVLFLSMANAQFDAQYNGNVFLVSSTGGTAQLLAPDFPYDVQSAAWSQDGQSIFLVANMGVHSELFQLDLATDAVTQLTDGNHDIDGWSFIPSANRHIFRLDEPTRPGDVWLLSSGREQTPVRVTGVYDYLARDFRLPRQERIQWKGADGVTVEGLIFYPLDYEAGRRYPLCVKTHGGPESSDKFGFSGRASVLTAMGYVVFEPNYRGSTGYGDAFLRDMVGGYFRNSHLDVMTGVDHLIALGIADGDRMVKMGWSAGGHMTNKIITFTDRFKAAVSGAGVANWVSYIAQGDMGWWDARYFRGTPWQEHAPIDLYWEHSPLKYVSKVKTPTLFLVGENDLRVPMPQSVEMYRALESNGVPTHLYVAPREGHGWRELRHQLFRLNVQLDWFEKYATKRPYVWETAPGDRVVDEGDR